jgi:hypothetical protein
MTFKTSKFNIKQKQYKNKNNISFLNYCFTDNYSRSESIIC